MMLITSTQNKLFKKFKSLNLKKNRESERLFILEGQRYIDSALSLGYAFEAIIFDHLTWEEQVANNKQHVYLDACQVYVLTEALIKELTQTEQTQGIIGISKIIDNRFDMDSFDDNVLFLDRIQDPGNLGTIIRTADAAGFNTLLMAKGTVDPYNPKVVRSTAGSILNIRLIEMDDKLNALINMKEAGFKIIVTALENTSDYNLAENYGMKNCIVIGNEANGVSNEILEIADVRVKIPIIGKAESLNASVAAALMMYKIREFSNE